MKIQFPEEWATDKWYGFTRHKFVFEGHNAWIVEPRYPAGDGRWSWTLQWAEAFVPRTGVPDLLEHGFYHTHIDVFETRCNPEGVEILARYQKFLVGMGLAPKACIIGMSWGGLFSLRYAETHPENVCAIYLDAPVCDASENTPASADRFAKISELYKLTQDELKVSPLNPINNVAAIKNIPVLGVVGLADQTVDVETNFNVFEERFKAAGGNVEAIKRPAWGHHPHGLDDTTPILDFFTDNL